MQLTRAIERVLLGQRGHLYPWAPVFFACGIGTFFGLKTEPALWAYLAFGACAFGAGGVLVATRSVFAPLLWAIVLVSLGFCAAGVRAHFKAAPVLEFRYYGPVQGRIVGVDRSSSGSMRLLLDQVVLERMSAEDTPSRVRVSLQDAREEARVRPGSTVLLTANLSPPSGPVEPGGFDFQRHAWFLQLGAVGYARTPLMLLKEQGWNRPVLQVRHRFAAFVRSKIGGESGAFAAAIMTGDRSGMSQATITDLRRTNLAHLLAISGLHMGLLTALVFGSVRVILLMLPVVRSRLPIRKVAAVVALVASFFYLLLAGGNVATERAFIMATVALGAVMFERRVFSLRAVATAALIVLALRPEALMGPGFQMSFAATTALVCVFAALRDLRVRLGPRWMRPIATVFISSLVAGLATAPVAAAHFNQFAHYGLIANLLAVPLMGALVMPAGLLAVVLWPVGLSGFGFWLMEQGVDWILGVASYVSQMEGARGTVVSPDPEVLVVLALGALTVALWQGRWRALGAAPVALAFALWWQTERPAVLIADTGGLVGVLAPEGRALSKARGAGFVAANWLENDGDQSLQSEAAERWAGAVAELPTPVLHVWRKRDFEGLSCADGEILVVNRAVEGVLPCHVYDPQRLAQTGSVALFWVEGVLHEKTARAVTGRRLWNALESDQ